MLSSDLSWPRTPNLQVAPLLVFRRDIQGAPGPEIEGETTSRASPTYSLVFCARRVPHLQIRVLLRRISARNRTWLPYGAGSPQTPFSMDTFFR